MANVDVTRIAGNIGALNSLLSLQNINSQLSTHQARLATGKRLMEAADDPSGMSMATTFDIRRMGMKTTLSAIGDARNLMSTAEGGLTKIKDILIKMRNKALESQGDTIGTTEKEAIQTQLRAYRDEINAIAQQTQWNGTALLNGTATTTATSTAGLNFLTDASGGLTNFSFAAGTTAGSGVILAGQSFMAGGTATSGQFAGATGVVGLALTDANLTVATGGSAAAANAFNAIDSAVNIVKAGIAQVGSFQARLMFKEDALSVQYANTEAAYNRIMNANMAEEQVEVSKLTILQQTATASLAQANTAPQFLLQLFR
ncbi:MAG: flagellin [Anaerolineales bacterium]|nr:flagellin [Anaerolineales bacterium]